ncbi:hypothetical protein RHMOL_Rhmol03G0202700 [Rhododendron molle]|uniref:Uncharacterized protein n=1 Tax=Rhododendron molle TaxID=49168 RepID=A0ACC0PHW9_RHOML|nr:hypothetical protein RHMOL_Rhmol03G0202700 [Rhododendron molle]
MQEAELAERINALDDLEIEVDLEDDDDFEEGACLPFFGVLIMWFYCFGSILGFWFWSFGCFSRGLVVGETVKVFGRV